MAYPIFYHGFDISEDIYLVASNSKENSNRKNTNILRESVAQSKRSLNSDYSIYARFRIKFIEFWLWAIKINTVACFAVKILNPLLYYKMERTNLLYQVEIFTFKVIWCKYVWDSNS